jgi:transposase
MRREEPTEEQREKIVPLLPPQKPPRRGRPAKDQRTVLNAILWVLRTGAPWRDLPERHGPWQTAASRFYRWQRAGLWQEILRELHRHEDRRGEVEWEIHLVDSTTVRAHQHAAGAKGGAKDKP